ncbi:RNA polymerase sigma factor SigJ [Amycolatopsis alkalitolerans]|uniref:Sigma-70 family RNA polymerase sigma factor n=1 Tax=Amycolatopsis alkalitolerans TaxID=2547244 RepID=A0A5C4M865_9PSEU|nr:RNA polymerase sigma factor SigJ [Amycolatopsis alkalitolerans]TNC29667.1 sigma-70 family RNA polymerase sigma factor [Amycolatopsis alkalitolerans]
MDDETRLAEFEDNRPRLFGLAYRMLGEAGEAEDVVQDAYLRWRSGPEPASPAAWLTKIVTNLCLTRLTSARARRERYVGPWLPEPVLTGGPDPQELAEQRDMLSVGFLVLLEKLTPPERAAFVLRAAFEYSHREIAGVLRTSEAHARQLYHRARARVGEPRRRFTASPGEEAKLVERFLAAALEGDVAGLERLLTGDAAVWSDGGGKATAARRPISGRAATARFLGGFASTSRAKDAKTTIAEVNGEPAILVWENGMLTGVLVPETHEGRIATIHAIFNPDKLAFLRTQLG